MTGVDSLQDTYGAAVRAHKVGDTAAAVAGYRAALRLDPGHLPSINNLGALLAASGEARAAEQLYQAGLAHHPSSPELHGNYAHLLRDRGDFPAAADHYTACLAAAPDNAEIRYALGVLLRRLGRHEDAARHLERVSLAMPADARPWTARAAVALDTGALGEAAAAVGQALRRAPDDADALNLQGLIARAGGDHDTALGAFGAALCADPDHAEAHYNRGALGLLLGDMPAAWSDYEWRWRGDHALVDAPAGLPLWRDEDIRGKTVLLVGEQGYGDTIQFVRYAPLLKDRGCRVLIQCRPALTRLMASAPGIDGVVDGDGATAADYWLPLMSLPHRFQTTPATIPCPEGYLSAVPSPRAASHEPVIGLVWAGSPSHENDANRSIPLQALAPLLDLDDAAFISLQFGPQAAHLAAGGRHPAIGDGTSGIQDFADTAERLMSLDLLITVDTAVAHLAGALGKPAWVVLPHVPDWRWMLNRDDTPWYRSLRLFRQESSGDWHGPVQRMRKALADR